MCESQQGLAQHFCQFFTDKMKKIWEEFGMADDFHFRQQDTPAACHLSGFEEVSEQEVLKFFQNPQENVVIWTQFLHDWCATAVVPAMTSIIHNSLKLGEVPPVIKVAEICPVLKKGNLDSNVVSNFRPVSNLCLP